MTQTPQNPAGQHPALNNLPLALTSFVGREREISEAKQLLLGETRLLTLIGVGGSGKTRLGVALAFEAVGDFEDGACWAGLAPLSDPDLVPQAIIQALAVGEQPAASLTDTLVQHLGRKKLLLVLDNCEHLIDACAALADVLLRSCPKLKILATSREALGVAGEVSWPVPPLSLPDPERLPPMDELARYEAVGLFAERARAAVPSFALTEHNAETVARLCRRLEGMPLAIELAAAKTRALSVEQILERLEDSLKLLAGTDRTAPARQRTLRATLDWSHEFLVEQEQVLFGRLSVFAGGFSLEAAEAVGTGEGIGEGEVLDLLSRLVDKSMVVAEASQGAEGAVRYRMLEPVRQYGLERLEESGEAERGREGHARYFLALAEEAEPELKGKRQIEWLDRLEEDHDNLRGAIQWALEQGETEIALRLTASAAHLWYPRGYLNEGRRRLGAVLAAGGPAAPAVRAKALTEAGFFALEQSDYDQAERSLEESLLLYRNLDDEYGVAHALECLSLAKTRLGDYGQASQLQEESLALYRELGHEWGIAVSLANLGTLAFKQGDYERATASHQESLGLLREVGDSLTTGYVLSLLGEESLMQGQLESSAAFLEESQSLLRQLGNKSTLATTLRNLAKTVLRQGDDIRAADLYKESLELAAEEGSKARVAAGLEGLAEVALAQGQPARAARLWGATEALREAIDFSVSFFDHSHYGYEERLAAARAQLNETAWEAAWQQGWAMRPEEAIGYALSVEEEEAAPVPSQEGRATLLSAREAEVLRLVAQGLTDPQVARDLYISPRTVGFHLRSVYRKLGVPSRAAAVRETVERSLI